MIIKQQYNPTSSIGALKVLWKLYSMRRALKRSPLPLSVKMTMVHVLTGLIDHVGKRPGVPFEARFNMEGLHKEVLTFLETQDVDPNAA